MMFLARVLFGALTTWCTISAITVPIDRADVQLTPTRPSMIANGWRPLTGYENIGTNVSPSSTLDRNAPHHPVLGKLHGHMQQAASEKVKPQTKNQKAQEYTPPSILGSFSVFGHAATKSRPKPKEYPKQSTAATTHYSFLVPPPRDSFRFEIDPNRKTMLRDNEQFLRQPTYISQSHQTDVNPSQFFSKGAGFTSSTTHSPSFSKSRPFVINGINGFGVQQPIHNLRHNQPQQFEVQKASNTKSYFQPPGLENAHNFAKDTNSEAVNFGRFQNHPHSSQIPNGGAGNFYSQVDHPAPFKGSYERDPSFLVHESHEISYVTPSSNFGYNFRPSLPYDNLVPPNLFSSTTAPKVESNKFVPPQSGGVRNDHYKQFELNNSPEDSLIKAQALPHGLPAGTYYLQGEQRPAASWPQQKSKFTTEINEVLPRKNPPAKFRQEAARPNPIFGNQPEVIFIRPNGQQQFENPISPGQVHQTTSSEPEYETPESISLKHFNEQQFLLQQQLVQQDRQRLQEQELQRQREQQRKQEEEIRKRQEEIRVFEQQEKEAQQKKLEEEIKQQQQQDQQKEQQQVEHEQQKLQEEFELRAQHQMQEQIEQRKQQQAQEELEQRKQEQLRQQLEEQKKLHEQQFVEQQQEYNRPVVSQERNPTQQAFQPPQENFESTVTAEHESKKTAEQPQQEVQPQIEPEVRPYRPKFPQRGPTRRRRPLSPAHVAQATEASVQDVGTYHSVTEAAPQTTVEPELTTIPVPVTLRPRNRRPGQPLKRRRPFSTTTTPQYESSSVTSPSIREPETSSRYQSLDTDFSKRRRARPTQPTIVTEETVTERHYIRKRPTGHRQRVNPGEPFEAEVVTEIVRPTRIIYKDTTEWENYPESFKKKDSQEIDTSSLPSQTLASSQDMEQVSTENGQVFEFSTETVEPEEVTGFEEQIRSSRPTQQSYDDGGNIPLEQLFVKPEENHVEPATTSEDFLAEDTTSTTTTTTTSTTTTTQIPSTTTEVTSTTRQSHRIRPLKYGNATRPRFSIKDYKSRLDYKNRLSQISTTESAPISSPGRRRSTTERPEDTSAGYTPRETTSRYKYMSRVAHRPTTSSPATSPEEVDEETTTERVNRFMPKRKLNMNLYRSRVTAATPQGGKFGQEDNRQSTTRPENIFSSAIRRPRPSYRNRNQPDVTPTEGATEMTAEETSFYSAMTTPRLKGNSEKTSTTGEDSGDDDDQEKEAPNAKESGNEVFRNEDVGVGNKVEDTSGGHIFSEENESEVTVASPTRRMQDNQQEDDTVSQNESIPTLPAWTEPSRDAEDALISQRIANLTSSASELYEPGMFKAVSPATESRVISPHFAIATDEPTLPIEAFFQVLATKKDE